MSVSAYVANNWEKTFEIEAMTQKPPVGAYNGGVRTMSMCLWGAGRLAMLAAGTIGPLAAAVLDALFLAVLAGLVARELVAGRNRRNLPTLAILAAFLGTNLAFHAG